jgi:hypothetical protein
MTVNLAPDLEQIESDAESDQEDEDESKGEDYSQIPNNETSLVAVRKHHDKQRINKVSSPELSTSLLKLPVVLDEKCLRHQR